MALQSKEPTEASVREDLAAVYRLCHRMGLNEGVCNHLTALVPGHEDQFLVIPHGLLWCEVTADKLLKVAHDGKILAGRGEYEISAFEIHRAIHLTDLKRHAVVLHTHMPYTTSLCCVATKNDDHPLKMCNQNSLRFYDDVAVDPVFHGLVCESDEGNRLAKAMGDKQAMLHRHHGVIVCGPTVAEAFDDLYYLERACMVQVLAMSTGQELLLVDDKTAKATKDELDKIKPAYAKTHLEAWKRELRRTEGSGNYVSMLPFLAGSMLALTTLFMLRSR